MGLLLMTGNRTLQAMEDSVGSPLKHQSSLKEKVSNQLGTQQKSDQQDPRKIRKLDTVDEIVGSFKMPLNQPGNENSASSKKKLKPAQTSEAPDEYPLSQSKKSVNQSSGSEDSKQTNMTGEDFF